MRKREKSRKHRIITIIIALAVILALLLSAVSCSGCGRETPAVTTAEAENTTGEGTTSATGPAVGTDPTDGDVTEPTIPPDTEPTTEPATVPATEPATEPGTEPATAPTDPKPTETQPTEPEPTECRHNYVPKITKAATCTEAGTWTYCCYSCGSTYTESIPPYGHEYKTETVAPTQTSQGYDLHTCTRCGDSYKDNYTDMLPPDTEPVTEPTGCQHHWKYVAAVTHEIPLYICHCGEVFYSRDEVETHQMSFLGTGEDAINHTSWYKDHAVVVDTTAYWECTKCGEVSETEP